MTSIGDLKMEVLTGTFANGDSTGEFVSGFSKVLMAFADYQTAAKVMNCSVSGSTITIATEDPGATKTFNLVVWGY
jgi:hypothetical protein